MLVCTQTNSGERQELLRVVASGVRLWKLVLHLGFEVNIFIPLFLFCAEIMFTNSDIQEIHSVPQPLPLFSSRTFSSSQKETLTTLSNHSLFSLSPGSGSCQSALWICQVQIFHIMEPYSTWPFVFVFFHVAQCFRNSSIEQCVSVYRSIYGCIIFHGMNVPHFICLFIGQWDVWVASLCCCEQCGYQHLSTSFCLNNCFHFFSVYTQK